MSTLLVDCAKFFIRPALFSLAAWNALKIVFPKDLNHSVDAGVEGGRSTPEGDCG